VQNQILLAILGSVILFGMVLLAVFRADRLRESREQRLKAATAGVIPAAGGPTVSLRRPLRQRAARGFFLLPSSLWTRLEGALAATGGRIGVPHLAVAAAIAAIAVILYSTRMMGFNPAVTVTLSVAAAIAAPIVLLRFFQRRYRNRFLDAFPEALDLIGRAVRAGLPVFDAMEVAAGEIRAPVSGEFQRTLDDVRIGVELEEALRRTALRVRVPDFWFYVVALTLQRRTGGSLAETLGNLSNLLRRRKEIRLKARALTAESKASAVVLGIVPFFVGGVLFLITPALMSVLIHDPRGRFMLGLAILSVAVGMVVMAVMIERSLR
jgi:tight adherence protein B